MNRSYKHVILALTVVAAWTAALAALAVVLLSTGRGSDVMVPMALPVFGGMVLALVSIFVVPACYCGLKQAKWRLGWPDQDFAAEPKGR